MFHREGGVQRLADAGDEQPDAAEEHEPERRRREERMIRRPDLDRGRPDRPNDEQQQDHHDVDHAASMATDGWQALVVNLCVPGRSGAVQFCDWSRSQ